MPEQHEYMVIGIASRFPYDFLLLLCWTVVSEFQ